MSKSAVKIPGNLRRWCLLTLLLVTSLTVAQPTPTPPLAAPDLPYRLNYGEIVNDVLDNTTPRRGYTFEGLAGEYVTVRLRVTSGNLDTVLMVVDDTGRALVTRDDSGGSIDAQVELIRLTANARYTVIVGRFGFAAGTTSGEYELSIERVGRSSESGSRLRYGDTVVNAITNEQPEVFYSFEAAQGDIVTITMRRDSESLDPYLRLVNASRQIVAENDDFGGSKDARIENFIIPADGSYAIIASRYGTLANSQSEGDFLLTLNAANENALGTTPEVAVRLEAGAAVEGEITDEQFTRYYIFTAVRDQVVTLRMNRITGDLDPLLRLADAELQTLAENDDLNPDPVNRNQNSEILEYRIPADGTYYVVATRFEEAAGLTTGRYRLEFISIGDVFAELEPDAARLNYGTTVTGTITAEEDTVLYAFYGVQGDTVTASVVRQSGELLPDLRLLDSRQRELIADTGAPGDTNVQINRFTLPQSGLYYLSASRAPDLTEDGTQTSTATTTGTFALTLAQRFD